MPMKDAVEEVITWCNSNPEELVVFYLTSCDGEDGCKEAALALMAEMGVYTITDCASLDSLSIEAAKAAATLPGGGLLLGLYDCIVEQYDPTVNCYGKGFACYEAWSTESTEFPWEKFTFYMDEATEIVPTTDGRLWMAQAHWQSTAGSITIGTLHNSSLLLDEERSGVNKWTAQSIREGRFKHLNIIEVDNVCDGGLDILGAIKSWN
ncbi:unnamed protein product [Symbiodinium microadriaticum]|nr:unnamed protein product [Symbiodinium microadriaticum]